MNTTSSFNASERGRKHKAGLQAQTRHLRVNRCDASKTALYLCLYLCYHPGLNLRHKETSKKPWVQETFHARIPVKLTQKTYFILEGKHVVGSARQYPVNTEGQLSTRIEYVYKNTQVLIDDTVFTPPTWRRACYFNVVIRSTRNSSRLHAKELPSPSVI